MTQAPQTQHASETRLTRRRALAGLGAGGLGLTVGMRPGAVAAQEGTPAMGGEVPPVVQAWADAWTAADREALLALYTDDATFEEVAFGEAASGKEAIGAVLEQEFATFADLTVEVVNAFQVGNRAAAEVIFSATYANQLPGGPPASGQPIALRVAVIFDLEGDLIRRDTEYFDAYGFLVQLGALPAPEGEAAAEATPA